MSPQANTSSSASAPAGSGLDVANWIAASIAAEMEAEIEAAIEFATSSPEPVGSDALDHVFA